MDPLIRNQRAMDYIWIVGTGEYSDYGEVAAYNTLAQAMTAVEKCWKQCEESESTWRSYVLVDTHYFWHKINGDDYKSKLNKIIAISGGNLRIKRVPIAPKDLSSKIIY